MGRAPQSRSAGRDEHICPLDACPAVWLPVEEHLTQPWTVPLSVIWAHDECHHPGTCMIHAAESRCELSNCLLTASTVLHMGERQKGAGLEEKGGGCWWMATCWIQLFLQPPAPFPSHNCPGPCVAAQSTCL